MVVVTNDDDDVRFVLTSLVQLASGMKPMENESISASEMVTTESESVTTPLGEPSPFSIPAVRRAFCIMSVWEAPPCPPAVTEHEPALRAE